MIKLGYRFGLLQIVLELGKYAWTRPKMIEALNALGDPKLARLGEESLSRALNATHFDKLEASLDRSGINSALVALIKRLTDARDKDFWARHHTTPEQLEEMLDASDSEFLAYLSRLAARKDEAPSVSTSSSEATGPAVDTLVRPNLNAVNRQDTDMLKAKLGGKCFLYRLGKEDKRVRKGGRLTGETRMVPVLRRIPVELTDDGAPYLVYRDAYSFYQEAPENDYAEGSAFCTKDHFTIVAADYDSVKRAMELFLIQLDDNPSSDWPGEGVYEGMMVMNGDQSKPTACKVLFRRAPADLQEIEWDAYVERCQRKIYLKQENDDYSIEETQDPEAEFESRYSRYLDKLLIREAKIDVTLGWS